MEVNLEISEEDYRSAQKLADKKMNRVLRGLWSIRISSWLWMLCAIYFVISGAQFWEGLSGRDELNFRWVFFSGLFGMLGLLAWLVLAQRAHRNLRIASHVPFPVREKIVTSVSGLSVDSRRVYLEIPWAQVSGISENDEHLILDLFEHYVYAVPKSSFESDNARNEFKAIVEHNIQH